jgi:hypothetical protein
VHDAGGMGLGQRLARLEHPVHGRGDRQRTARLDLGLEIASLEVLHHQIGSAILERAHVEHARHVLALDASRGPGLAPKAGDHALLPRDLGQQELERHPPVELQVVSGHDDAHAPSAEHALDAKPASEHVTRARDTFEVRPSRIDLAHATRPRMVASILPLPRQRRQRRLPSHGALDAARCQRVEAA